MLSPKLCVCVLVVFECACVSRLYGSGSDDRTQLCSHSVEGGGGGVSCSPQLCSASKLLSVM